MIHDEVQSGQLDHNHIFYKLNSDIMQYSQDLRHEFGSDVKNFLSSLEYHGHQKVNYVI